MLSLDALLTTALVYDQILAADAYREKVAAKGDKPDFGPWLAGLAEIVRAERPVVAGIIGTLTIVAKAQGQPTSVRPHPSNDDHTTTPEQPTRPVA